MFTGVFAGPQLSILAPHGCFAGAPHPLTIRMRLSGGILWMWLLWIVKDFHKGTKRRKNRWNPPIAHPNRFTRIPPARFHGPVGCCGLWGLSGFLSAGDECIMEATRPGTFRGLLDSLRVTGPILGAVGSQNGRPLSFRI